MNNQNTGNAAKDATANATARDASATTKSDTMIDKKANATGATDTVSRKQRVASKASTTAAAIRGGKSKKDQLVAMLSKPNGARISVIVGRLGWQAHTVRAALSGLRKQGLEVTNSKSSKTGETVYSIVTLKGAKKNGAAL